MSEEKKDVVAKPQKTKVTNIKADQDVGDIIRAMAAKEHTTQSEIIRRLIERELSEPSTDDMFKTYKKQKGGATTMKDDIMEMFMLKMLQGDGASGASKQGVGGIGEVLAMKLLTQPDPLVTMMALQQTGRKEDHSEILKTYVQSLQEQQRDMKEYLEKLVFGKETREAIEDVRSDTQEMTAGAVKQMAERMDSAIGAIQEQIKNLPQPQQESLSDQIKKIATLRRDLKELGKALGLEKEKPIVEGNKVNWGEIFDRGFDAVKELAYAMKQQPPPMHPVEQIPTEPTDVVDVEQQPQTQPQTRVEPQPQAPQPEAPETQQPQQPQEDTQPPQEPAQEPVQEESKTEVVEIAESETEENK